MVRLAMYEKNAKAKAICESDETDKLEELITDFMSKSNDSRSDAKLIFEICINKPNPDVFANKLYRVLSSSPDLDSRTISAILLRKLLINKFNPPFLRFPPETQSTLKRDLLKLVDKSVDTRTRAELCHTVSALAASLLPKKEWPEFLPFVFQLITSDKKSALLIVAHLAQYLGKELIGAHLAQSLGKELKELYSVKLDKELHSVNLDKELHSVNLDKELHSVLLQCLTEGEGEDIRIAVCGAAINFILCLEQNDLANYQDMLTAMICPLKKALYSGNEMMADAIKTMKLLINLAGMKPMFLRKQIVEMVKTILLMTYDHSLEKGTRRLAIEFVLTLVQFVLTLAEVEKTNPRQLKLGTEFDINMGEMSDDNEKTGKYGSWQGCVDTLSTFWDRNDILTAALKVFPAYLAAPKGQKPHAALIALLKSIITWNCWECLLKERELDVHVAALGDSINFIPCPDLLALTLSTLEDVLKDKDEVMACQVLKLLIDLWKPGLLMGQIMEQVKRMWQIANNDCLNIETRSLAIDFLLKLAQVEEIAPWLQQNVRKLFEILMNTLDHINDDDPDADDVSTWESSNQWRLRECLDILFVAVDRNDMFSVILEVLPAYLDAPEWQKKYITFTVIAENIKSCRETQVTLENLEQVVPMVLRPFPNAHRRVRCAAIEAIEQFLAHLLCFRLHEEVMRTNFELVMSTLLSSFQDEDPVVENASIHAIEVLALTLGEHLQVGCHLVLPALAKVMSDSPNQDIRARAASIILDFSEYCSRDNLSEHLDRIRSSCLIVSQEVKEFVTRNRFTELEWRSSSLWNDRLSEEGDHSWQEELLEAWVQLWQNEERDFSPYLEILMSPVFDAAQLDPDGQLDPHVIRYAGVNIIEQKAMACHVLCFCVDELKELLFPLIYRVVDTLIPFSRWDQDSPVLLSPECYYAKAIRIAVVSAMPKILNSARKVVESSDPEDYDHALQYVEELSDMVIGALNEASDVEPDEDVRYNILDALNDCVQ